MYRINGEVIGPSEIANYISALTSGVVTTDAPLELGSRNSTVFSGDAFLHYFLKIHETTEELDMNHIQEILAYDLIKLDMTEHRCFSEWSLLWIRKIIGILSKSRPILILVRNIEDLERNYETLITGIKHDSITMDE